MNAEWIVWRCRRKQIKLTHISNTLLLFLGSLLTLLITKITVNVNVPT